MSLSDEEAAFRSEILLNLRRVQFRLENLAMLQRAALLGSERILRFLYQDEEISFYLPFASVDEVQRTILQTNSFFEVHLLEGFRSFVPPSAVVVDVGANIGNHAIYFAKICGAKKIFAFEPLRETFRMLLRNVDLNARDRIECYNLALGSTKSKAMLHKYASSNIGATRLNANAVGRYDLVSLDSFNFDRLDVIKLDVEGAEADVLEGARETLSRLKPTIMVEILPETGNVTDEKLSNLAYRRVKALSDRDFVYQSI